MAKFCVFLSMPIHGSRDEVIGVDHGKDVCFKTLRKARAYLKKQGEDFHRHWYPQICKGERWCGQRKAIDHSKRRQRPTSAAQRKAAKRRDKMILF